MAGHALTAEASVEEFLAGQARAFAAHPVRVSVADVPTLVESHTLGELGVRLDVARMAELVRGVGHWGPLQDRREQARRALAGTIDIPWVFEVVPGTLFRTLASAKDAVDDLPQAAKFDVDQQKAIGGSDGRLVDLDAAIGRLRGIAAKGETELVLSRVSVPPRVSRDYVAKIDAHQRLGRFQTGFSRAGEQASRAHNIETAAARLDGVVLLPHELFSFNSAVGPRTVDNGFSKGWQIFKGEMVEGIGGGTCQVASTLHAVAMFAGLDVIERLPHSRPSAYITMGLDATVVFPVVDLKLRNPFDFPVVVHTQVEGNQIMFELYGQEHAPHVTFGREILATRAFSRKVEEKYGVPADRVIRKQHGIRGYKVRRTRTIVYYDGSTRKESNVDVYPPTIEEFVVAPGADVASMLPALEGEETSDGRPAKWVSVKNALPAAEPTESARSSASAAPDAAGGAATSSGPSAAACSGDCQASQHPTIVNMPGVHAPTAEQVRAKVRVVFAPPSGPRGGVPPR